MRNMLPTLRKIGLRPLGAALLGLSALLLGLAGCSRFSFYSLVDGEDLSITPPAVILNTKSTFTFAAAGGLQPYGYNLQTPAHGIIDSTSGCYSAPDYSATDLIRLSDDLGNTASATVLVMVSPVLTIDPYSATVTVGSEIHFRAYGGVGPYLFEVAQGTGLIDPATGSYTAPATPELAVVRVTDQEGSIRSADIIIVATGPLAVIPDTLTIEQNHELHFSASGGTPPYTFGAASGMIDPSSGFYRAPAAPGTDTVTVRDSVFTAVQSAVLIAPCTPTNLQAGGSGGRSILLDWTDTASGEEGFSLERKEEGGAYVVIATVGPDVTSYLDQTPKILPNTLYVYRLRSFYGSTYSPYSNEAFTLSNL